MGNFLESEEMNSCAKPMHMGKVDGGFTLPLLHLIQLFNFCETPTCSLFPLIPAPPYQG
jgi:hypothetical protein